MTVTTFTVFMLASFSAQVPDEVTAISLQENEGQTVPKTYELPRAISTPETTSHRLLTNPPNSEMTTKSSSKSEEIVDIEVVPSSRSSSSATYGDAYSRSRSSPGAVNIDITNSRSSWINSRTPSSSSLRASSSGATPTPGTNC